VPSVLDPEITRLGQPGFRMPGAATPTTVSIGRGQVAGAGNQSRATQLLGYIGQAAIKAGLGAEGAKVAQAIAVTEGGLTGAVGDVSGGGSFGPFQFYAQGQLRNFAASMKMSTEQAKQAIARNPEVAIDWALRGYLGNTIRVGMQRGLSGAQLATYAQDKGQVSESPERAGVNYRSLFAAPGAQPLHLGAGVGGQAQQPGAGYGAGLVPNQFDSGLTSQEAASACGPAAAIAFARKYGRNPSMQEALTLAKTVGWTQTGGMNGLQNQEKLIRAMAKQQGIEMPVKGEYGSVNWDNVIHDAMQGNPVTVSTAIHYYVVDGYDPSTQRFHVGNSGVVRKDLGKAWVTAAEIVAADGQPNGALYVDDPRVPGKSVATRQDTGARDDWRISARPTTNYGYLPSMDEAGGVGVQELSDWQPWDERGQKRPDWNPYETPGWDMVRNITQQVQGEAAQRRQDFLQEFGQPLVKPKPYSPQPIAPYQSVFAPLLNPRRGTPLDEGFTAPGMSR
jgi:hypothetical protein